MERPLSAWELAVLTVLAGVRARGADAVREAIPHVVVTGEADGDDRSFDLRDTRSLDDVVPEGAMSFSRARTPDGNVRYLLLVDSQGRPVRVEEVALPEGAAAAPDPHELLAEADGLSTRWLWAAAAAVVAVGGTVFGWSVYNGYGPDTSGKQTCAVHASIIERDEDRQEWFAERCVEAVRTGGR